MADTDPAATHWGTSPAHGGLIRHRGPQGKCLAPDCMDATPDPAATLHAMAAWFRAEHADGAGTFWLALAEHVEGAIYRSDPANCICEGMICRCDTGEVAELLAVATAAGVTP